MSESRGAPMAHEALFAQHLNLAHSRFWHWSHSFPRSFWDDLRQEMLLQLWRACLHYDPAQGAFSTLAYAYMDRAALNLLRARRAQKRTSMTVPLDSAKTVCSTLSVEAQAIARIALQSVSTDMLALACGFRQAEIASHLGTSQASVSRRMTATRRRLVEEAIV